MLIYYGHEYGVEYQGITYFIKMLNATTYLTYAGFEDHVRKHQLLFLHLYYVF